MLGVKTYLKAHANSVGFSFFKIALDCDKITIFKASSPRTHT